MYNMQGCLQAAEYRVRNMYYMDFPGSSVVKTLHSNAGGAGSIPGQGA